MNYIDEFAIKLGEVFFEKSKFVKIDQHFCWIFDQFACVVKIRCWQAVFELKTGII